MSRSVLGTLNWAETNNGALSRSDVFSLACNLAYVQMREFSDTLRQKFHLLRLPDLMLEALRPPTTSLAKDALAYAEETHSQALLFHSWRTYFLGRLIAEQGGLDYDNDIFFAAAILHDVGLTDDCPVPVSQCCFAVQGGRQVKSYLDECGHAAATVHKVSEAIALHLNIHVRQRLHGAEAHMLARGATCDLFGFGRRRIRLANLQDLFERYPRDGVIEALRFETADHLTGSRPEFLTRLSNGKAPKTPFYDSAISSKG